MPGRDARNSRTGAKAGGQPERQRLVERTDGVDLLDDGADPRQNTAATRFGSSPDDFEDDAFISSALLEAYNRMEFDDSGSPDD